MTMTKRDDNKAGTSRRTTIVPITVAAATATLDGETPFLRRSSRVKSVVTKVAAAGDDDIRTNKNHHNSNNNNNNNNNRSKKSRYSRAQKRDRKQQQQQQQEHQQEQREEQPQRRQQQQQQQPNQKQKQPQQQQRLQHKSSSSVDTIKNCANKALFTQSVIIEHGDSPPIPPSDWYDSSNTSNTIDNTSAPASRSRVRIISCCNVDESRKKYPPLPPDVVVPSSTTMMTNNTTTVRVQPLLILDLNGVLCHRIRRNSTSNQQQPQQRQYRYRPSIGRVASTPIIPRIDLIEFLYYLDRHFCLAIWTSAKKKTVNEILSLLVPPDIRDRLLFVWHQGHCRRVNTKAGNNKTNAGITKKSHKSTTAVPNDVDNDGYGTTTTTTSTTTTTTSEDDDEQHGGRDGRSRWDDIVFEKHLPKVWREYPLWSANNTLLIDDSPDKCPYAIANAIHPPPLNGLSIPDVIARIATGGTGQTVPATTAGRPLTDTENERLQRDLFQNLVQFWTSEIYESVIVDNDDDDEVTTAHSSGSDMIPSSNKIHSATATTAINNDDDNNNHERVIHDNINTVYPKEDKEKGASIGIRSVTEYMTNTCYYNFLKGYEGSVMGWRAGN